MSDKKIDTLVDDIYELLDKGKPKPNNEYLFGMAASIMDAVRKQLWFSSAGRAKGALRMSNLGKPCDRALWYDIKGEHEVEPLLPATRLKFMMGDIAEALVLYLAASKVAARFASLRAGPSALRLDRARLMSTIGA